MSFFDEKVNFVLMRKLGEEELFEIVDFDGFLLLKILKLL